MELAAKITRALARAEVDAVEAEIERCLGMIGTHLELDIVSFCVEEGERADARLQWRAVGYMDPPLSINLNEASWWRQHVDEDVLIADARELPDEAAYERELLTQRGTRSLAAVPIGGRTRGFIAAETWGSIRSWSEADLELLAALASAVGGAIERCEHQRVLIRSAEEANRASREKSLFIATLGHELKTPLTMIQMNVEMLARGHLGELNEDQAGALRELEEATSSLGTVLNDLLDLARLDTGRMPLDLRRVDVCRTAERAMAMCKGRARERDVSLESELPAEDELVVEADDRKLGHVLSNLIVNGIKFSHPGGRVTLRLRAEDDEYQFEVEDDGIGIEKEDQDRIFGTFARASEFRRDRRDSDVGGSGLGLALVRGLTELHGGRLELESEPGRGSTFRVILPRKPRERTAGRVPYLGSVA